MSEIAILRQLRTKALSFRIADDSPKVSLTVETLGPTKDA
jgi:hypothetical protein